MIGDWTSKGSLSRITYSDQYNRNYDDKNEHKTRSTFARFTLIIWRGCQFMRSSTGVRRNRGYVQFNIV